MQHFVDAWRGKRILIVGDVALDHVTQGTVARHAPDGTPILTGCHEAYAPGMAGNVAANVAALGGVPMLLSVTGNDGNSQFLQVALNRIRCSRNLNFNLTQQTTVKHRIFAGEKLLTRMDTETIKPLTPTQRLWLRDKVEEEMPLCDAVVISDYAKGVVSDELCSRVLELAKRHGKPSVVDPKTAFSYPNPPTVIKPNMAGLLALTGDLLGFFEAGREYASRTRTEVIATRGRVGCSLFRPDKASVNLSALPIDAVDTCGAGDTCAAVLALALASGQTLEQGAWLAMLAAADVCTRIGTVTPQEGWFVQASHTARAL